MPIIREKENLEIRMMDEEREKWEKEERDNRENYPRYS